MQPDCLAYEVMTALAGGKQMEGVCGEKNLITYVVIEDFDLGLLDLVML